MDGLLRFTLSAMLLQLLSLAAIGQDAIEIFPLRFCTPLYEASIDVEQHCLLSLTATVTGDQIIQPIPEHVSRRWWQHETLGLLTLETADYTNSGLDRGHVYALLWASGSPDWRYVNLTAAIVPQYPATNQGPIKALEQHIADLAVEHGAVKVRIDIDYSTDLPLKLPEADETVGIPVAFRYRLQYGRRVELYRIPNSQTAEADYRTYRITSR